MYLKNNNKTNKKFFDILVFYKKNLYLHLGQVIDLQLLTRIDGF